MAFCLFKLCLLAQTMAYQPTSEYIMQDPQWFHGGGDHWAKDSLWNQASLLAYCIIIFLELLSFSCNQQDTSVSRFCLNIKTSIICFLPGQTILGLLASKSSSKVEHSSCELWWCLFPEPTPHKYMRMLTLWTEMSLFWVSFGLPVKFDWEWQFILEGLFTPWRYENSLLFAKSHRCIVMDFNSG